MCHPYPSVCISVCYTYPQCLSSLLCFVIIIIVICQHYPYLLSSPLYVTLTIFVCHHYSLGLSPLLPLFVTITPSVCHHYSLYIVLTILIISSSAFHNMKVSMVTLYYCWHWKSKYYMYDFSLATKNINDFLQSRA